MIRPDSLRPEFVQFLPEQLEEGVLYISRRYRTASHRCCCGCGLEVVTPLNPAKWQLTEHPDGSVSLAPSVGNWGFPCRSHYFVRRNRVAWDVAFSPEHITVVQLRDQTDVAALAAARQQGFWQAVLAAWSKLGDITLAWLNRH